MSDVTKEQIEEFMKNPVWLAIHARIDQEEQKLRDEGFYGTPASDTEKIAHLKGSSQMAKRCMEMPEVLIEDMEIEQQSKTLKEQDDG